MKLVVGLGNPGSNYKNNRHNIGFLFLDNLLKEDKFKKKKNYDFCVKKNTIFIKPKTYMNQSGNAVTAVQTEYRIDDILVIVDDINLPLGEIRLRHGGGSGGHNGLKSITASLGNPDYKRIRIGVNAPDNEDLSDFVLSNFSKPELETLSEVFELTEKLVEEFSEKSFEDSLNMYSKIKKSYSEKTKSQDRSDDNSEKVKSP
jgi:peptidyl-tRNA hydrolase, PTH1 family